jgi:O-antigen/teichoic acid export membrane protein
LREQLLSLASLFFSNFHWYADVPLVNWLSSRSELGIFAAGTRLLPAFRTVAVAMTLVAVPALCNVPDGDVHLRPILNKGIRQLGLVGCVLTLITWAGAELFVSAIFPPEFEAASQILRIVSLAIIPILLQWAYLNILWIRGQWITLGACYVLALLVQVVGDIFIVPSSNAVGAAWVLVASDFSAAVAMGLAVQRLTRNASLDGVVAAAITTGAPAFAAAACAAYNVKTPATAVLMTISFAAAACITNAFRLSDWISLVPPSANSHRLVHDTK